MIPGAEAPGQRGPLTPGPGHHGSTYLAPAVGPCPFLQTTETSQASPLPRKMRESLSGITNLVAEFSPSALFPPELFIFHL